MTQQAVSKHLKVLEQVSSHARAARSHARAPWTRHGTTIAYDCNGSGPAQRRCLSPVSLRLLRTTTNCWPAEHRSLDGQTHDVALEALAPVLVEFFAA